MLHKFVLYRERLIITQSVMAAGVALVDKALSMRPGVVLELCGPAGSGKTEMLLQVWTSVGGAGGQDAEHA